MSLIQIQRQYERIPTLSCKSGCADCCGPVPFTEHEWAALTDEERERPITSGSCQFSSDQGCTIYDRRPLMCRLFGTVEDLLCPHGCKPEKLLTAQQGKTIARHYRKHDFMVPHARDVRWAKGLSSSLLLNVLRAVQR